MRRAVLAAQHAAGAVADAIARGVAERELVGLHHKVERDAEPAAMLAVAAGIGQKLMETECRGKRASATSMLPNFNPRRCATRDRRPAVAARRGAAPDVHGTCAR